MQSRNMELFVLGATGFIGREVVREGLRCGYRVKALVRNPENAADLATAGAVIIQGDAARPAEWVQGVAGANVMIDLVQPELPQRIGLAAIRKIARQSCCWRPPENVFF